MDLYFLLSGHISALVCFSLMLYLFSRIFFLKFHFIIMWRIYFCVKSLVFFSVLLFILYFVLLQIVINYHGAVFFFFFEKNKNINLMCVILFKKFGITIRRIVYFAIKGNNIVALKLPHRNNTGPLDLCIVDWINMMVFHKVITTIMTMNSALDH